MLFLKQLLLIGLVDDHFHEVRYIKPWHDWHVFDGKRWLPDSKNKIEYFISRICIRGQRPSRQTPRNSMAMLISNHTARAVERLARSDPRIATGIDGWDTDPWLLNVQNGTIDLRTGKLGPHDQRHMMTKIAATTLDKEGAHPHWTQFMHAVTDNDRELEEYLQRVAGYCLTGVTS